MIGRGLQKTMPDMIEYGRRVVVVSRTVDCILSGQTSALSYVAKLPALLLWAFLVLLLLDGCPHALAGEMDAVGIELLEPLNGAMYEMCEGTNAAHVPLRFRVNGAALEAAPSDRLTVWVSAHPYLLLACSSCFVFYA